MRLRIIGSAAGGGFLSLQPSSEPCGAGMALRACTSGRSRAWPSRRTVPVGLSWTPRPTFARSRKRLSCSPRPTLRCDRRLSGGGADQCRCRPRRRFAQPARALPFAVYATTQFLRRWRRTRFSTFSIGDRPRRVLVPTKELAICDAEGRDTECNRGFPVPGR